MNELLASADAAYRLIIEESVDFAIFLIDRDGRIATWNPGAARIMGYQPDEIIGRHFSILFTEADRESGAPEREITKAERDGRAEDRRWHICKDGGSFFADGVTTAIRAGDGRLVGFSKITRDITDRHRAEQRLAAQLALTNILSEEQPFEEAARRIMQSLCESLGWDVGALWYEEGDILRCVDLWHVSRLDHDLIAPLCTAGPLPRTSSLPGRVIDTAAPVWVIDFGKQPAFVRGPIAVRAGLQGAFAFPIITAGRVIGAMEFFSTQRREPDQALLPAMALVGAQIGDYIERRRTAHALKESEERYRVVSQTAQDAIFTIDEESRILFCNPAVERVFGYKPEELVGQSLEVIIPESLRESHRRGMARFLATGRRNIPWDGVELTAVHRSGREVPVEISFGVWREGERTIFTGFARDITERRRATLEVRAALELEQQARAEEDAIRAQLERRAEEEASFRHLASALTGAAEMKEVLYEITNRATVVTRADGVYVERIIGPSRTVEIVSTSGRGTPARGTRVAYPGSLTEEMLEKRQPVILEQMDRVGRSMAEYLTDTCGSCELLVTPLIAEDEPLGALVLLNSKQSGRSFGEADVVRARTLGDLASLALRRVRLLEQEREAKQKAEAAVRVRDETLGIVSHDLRNPLTKIALSAELLRESTGEDREELVETIRVASRQMERLIQDLLDVARVESGRFAVEKQLIDVEPLVCDACDSNRPIADQKRQKIVCHVADGLPQLCADRDRLMQVFSNLIANAIKFTPERGTISVHAEVGKGCVVFRVRDSGPGIPEADLGRVFKPYWQAKKTAHMGAGLGLAIVRGIVEAHGGTVWAESPAGGGAQFTFTIPLES